MKRKGFTLIELLAVIVVLAIIALIAPPIVMNVIKNAQMGAAGTSSKLVTLILEGNFDAEVLSWCTDYETCEVDYPDGVMKKLDEIADVWTKLDRSQLGIPSSEQIVIADGQNVSTTFGTQLNNEWLYSDPNNEL